MHTPLEHLFLLCNFVQHKAHRGESLAAREALRHKSVERSVTTVICENLFESVSTVTETNCRYYEGKGKGLPRTGHEDPEGE